MRRFLSVVVLLCGIAGEALANNSMSLFLDGYSIYWGKNKGFRKEMTERANKILQSGTRKEISPNIFICLLGDKGVAVKVDPDTQEIIYAHLFVKRVNEGKEYIDIMGTTLYKDIESKDEQNFAEQVKDLFSAKNFSICCSVKRPETKSLWDEIGVSECPSPSVKTLEQSMLD